MKETSKQAVKRKFPMSSDEAKYYILDNGRAARVTEGFLFKVEVEHVPQPVYLVTEYGVDKYLLQQGAKSLQFAYKYMTEDNAACIHAGCERVLVADKATVKVGTAVGNAVEALTVVLTEEPPYSVDLTKEEVNTLAATIALLITHQENEDKIIQILGQA